MSSPIEKLQKFLKLEVERGYDNRAVVGGLDKILPNWENEARSLKLNENLIQTVIQRLNAYQHLDTSQRAATLQELFQMLQSIQETSRQPTSSQFQPRQQLSAGRSDDSTLSAHSAAKQSKNISIERQKRSNKISDLRPSKQTSEAGLNAPLTVLPGIGQRNSQILHELGLNNLGDLLYFFPRRYDDYSQLKPINRVQYGEELTIIATVQSLSTRPVRGGQLQITEAVVTDGSGFIRLTWFNKPWIEKNLHHGDQIVFSGKVDMYLGRLVMNDPEWEHIEQQHLHTNRIVPVYPLTSHITQRQLRRIMYQTVTFWAPRVTEYLPESTRQSVGLVDLSTALLQVHFPDSSENLAAARERLAFDEIFLMQLGVLREKQAWQSAQSEIYDSPEDWLNQQISRIPFNLTQAQQKVLQEVRCDLASGHPMNRLLQGDVGSGKTVIAALGIAIVARNGAQSALMAPTSILAEQHYRNLLNLLTGDHGDIPSILTPEQIALLIGDTPEPEKQSIRQGLSDGSIKLVIGTHALIEDPVEFQHLQLAVVDEQHRFGVAQRSALRVKGKNPHLLVMTATPIPRSLALTIYGDLDLSVMDELPPGRQPIETHVVLPLERERIYQLIRSEIRAGHQVFIIYPFIEKGDRDEAMAAVEEHDRLQKEIFPQFKLGLLHGRMRPSEKDQVMKDFRDGIFQVLVSTSVVEVGVDVPNATVMLVEGANRFGLAQLHQFRGRVGRGQDKAYCILIPETEDAIENERLAAMEETNDGFVLAERDLDQRGPGSFLGTRQSGFAELKMANLTDIHLIEKARLQARKFFELDPDFRNPEHANLATMMARFWGNGRGDIS